MSLAERHHVLGTTLAGRYDILELVGSGGMGSVYRARDRELDELVALKVIRAELASDATLIERFRREVKLARRVTHTNVARTFELGRDGDVVFCTMELVDGESLTARLAHGKLGVPAAVAIARAVCDGVAAAHAAGVIHRDIKPDNILIAADGRVAVADFGVAAAPLGDRDGISGTVAYMAPEQSLGEPPTPLVDVYAIGVVLYEMVTGHRAFTGVAAAILDAKLIATSLSPPVGGDVSADLAAVIATATQRDAAKRTTSADALRRALAPWAKHAPALAPAPGGGATASHATISHTVVVVAPTPAGGDGTRDHITRAVHDALLGKLVRTPRLRVLARVSADTEPGSHVVALGGDGRLAVRRVGEAQPVLALDLPLDVEHVAAAAEAGAAAVVAAVSLTAATVPDRAGAGYELWLKARHVTQLSLDSLGHVISLLEDAVKVAPEDPRILATLAMAHVRRAFFTTVAPGDVTRAAQLARTALARGPDVAEAHLAVGQLEFNIGDPLAAAGHFRVAISRAPHLAEGHEYLGKMLLEADYVELARTRLDEAIAIAPQLIGPRWDLARAVALSGEWAEYDRLVADLLVTGSTARTMSLARFAMWRGDVDMVRRTFERFGAEATFAPEVQARMFAVFFAPESWAAHRDAMLALAFDPEPVNRRRRAFVAQLVAETAAAVGDVEAAVRCVTAAIDNGMFDRAWLRHCPKVAEIAALPALADARAIVTQRAEAILDTLYGDVALHTLADTQLAH